MEVRKRLLLFIALIILQGTFSYGQPNKNETVTNGFSGHQLSVILVPEKKLYLLEKMGHSPDTGLSFIIIAEGDYSVNENFFEFRDRRMGNIMKAKLHNNKLTFISGFDFMVNQPLEEKNYYYKFPEMYHTESVNEWKNWSYPSQTITSLKNKKTSETLENGIYQWEYIFIRFNDDTTYDLYYNDDLLSRGIWKQENSCIVLYDEDLSSSFYMGLYGKEELKGVLLPGLYSPDTALVPFDKIEAFPPDNGDIPYVADSICRTTAGGNT